MNHKEWVKNQFRAVKGRAIYRDVIIHSCFIEAVSRRLGNGRDFQCSIKKLRANYPDYKTEVDKLEQLRKMRNRMIHDLLKDEALTNAEITQTIRVMKKVLREIYSTDNGLVNKFFKEKYQIDAKDFQ